MFALLFNDLNFSLFSISCSNFCLFYSVSHDIASFSNSTMISINLFSIPRGTWIFSQWLWFYCFLKGPRTDLGCIIGILIKSVKKYSKEIGLNFSFEKCPDSDFLVNFSFSKLIALRSVLINSTLLQLEIRTYDSTKSIQRMPNMWEICTFGVWERERLLGFPYKPPWFLNRF